MWQRSVFTCAIIVNYSHLRKCCTYGLTINQIMSDLIIQHFLFFDYWTFLGLKITNYTLHSIWTGSSLAAPKTLLATLSVQTGSNFTRKWNLGLTDVPSSFVASHAYCPELLLLTPWKWANLEETRKSEILYAIACIDVWDTYL